MSQIVTLKMQRPIMSNSSMQEVMSYVVDDDDVQKSNPVMQEMPLEDIELFFGDNYKVYYKAIYNYGQPASVMLDQPVRTDEWV
jgi:hypothetical protein